MRYIPQTLAILSVSDGGSQKESDSQKVERRVSAESDAVRCPSGVRWGLYEMSQKQVGDGMGAPPPDLSLR